MSYNMSFLKPQYLDQKSQKTLFQEIATIAMGSILIGLSAQVSIPLLFSPIPITMQTLAVLFLGASLGSKRGMLCVIAYIAEILAGLPVLGGGQVNPLFFIGPRAGYIMGFIFQAYLMGWFCERQSKLSLPKLLMAGTFTCLIQLAVGAAWLGSFVGWSNALPMGFYPFVPVETLKVLAISACFKRSA